MKNLQIVPVKMIVLPSWDPMSSSVYTTSVLLRGTLVDVLAVPFAPAKEQNNTGRRESSRSGQTTTLLPGFLQNGPANLQIHVFLSRPDDVQSWPDEFRRE